MNLPSSIQAFFDADKGNDGEALARTFAPDAVVKDEAGPTPAAEPSQPVARHEGQVPTPHRAPRYRQDGQCRQSTRQGDRPFLGSPVVRTFAFRLKDEIAGLDITE